VIELNGEFKNYLSKKFNVDKKLIYHFGYDNNMNKYKMVYHQSPNTLVRYVDKKEIRDFILKIKIKNILNNIVIVRKN